MLYSSGKNKYDTLDNLLGEMLIDIRALADHFLMASPNINRGYQEIWRKGPHVGFT